HFGSAAGPATTSGPAAQAETFKARTAARVMPAVVNRRSFDVDFIRNSSLTALFLEPESRGGKRVHALVVIDRIVLAVTSQHPPTDRPSGPIKSDESAVNQTPASLENLIDLQFGAVPGDRADADGHDAVQPGVFLCAGFEDRRRAEVEVRGRHGFAAPDAVHRGRTAGEDPAVVGVDMMAVVGPQRAPHVQLHDAVAALQQPVAAGAQHLAAQPRTFEGPAGEGDHQAMAARRGADIEWRADLQGHAVEQLASQFRHDISDGRRRGLDMSAVRAAAQPWSGRLAKRRRLAAD